MDHLFRPDIGFSSKPNNMDDPPLSVARAATRSLPTVDVSSQVDGRPDDDPLAFEKELYADAFNFARWSGALVPVAEHQEALRGQARAAAARLGAAAYAPGEAHSSDAALEQEQEERLSRRLALRTDVGQRTDAVDQARLALASHGRRPQRPTVLWPAVVTTLALCVPLGAGVYGSLGALWGHESFGAALASLAASLPLSAALAWLVFQGACVDLDDNPRVWWAWLAACALPGLGVVLLWAGAAAGPVAVGLGLGLLASIIGVLAVFMARSIHRARQTWEPRSIAWESAAEAVGAAERALARAEAELEGCERSIDAHIEGIRRRAHFVRAAEKRETAAEEAVVAGYLRGVAANQGDVHAWRRKARSRDEQALEYRRPMSGRGR